MSEPIPTTAADDSPECNDEPKLTIEEWAYVAAMSTGGEG